MLSRTSSRDAVKTQSTVSVPQDQRKARTVLVLSPRANAVGIGCSNRAAVAFSSQLSHTPRIKLCPTFPASWFPDLQNGPVGGWGGQAQETRTQSSSFIGKSVRNQFEKQN